MHIYIYNLHMFPISPVNMDIFCVEVVYLDYAGAALFSRAQLAATQALCNLESP